MTLTHVGTYLLLPGAYQDMYDYKIRNKSILYLYYFIHTENNTLDQINVVRYKLNT